MNTILILLGTLVGALAGFKFGNGRGLSKSFIIIDSSDLPKVQTSLDEAKAKHPDKQLDILFDREGFEVLISG